MLSKRTTEKATTPPTLHVGDFLEDGSEELSKTTPTNSQLLEQFRQTGCLVDFLFSPTQLKRNKKFRKEMLSWLS